MALKGAGYDEVAVASRGDDGWELIRSSQPDLVLLDLALPGLEGLEIARRIRADRALAATKILMLTAKSRSEDIVRGLEAGADDYVVKPYDRKVLLARVKAVLRRGLPIIDGIDFDGLTLDESSRSATLDGKSLELTSGEFELLVKLVAHRGRIFRRDADARSVDVQIVKLRHKLGAWAKHIETVRGIGYRVG